MVDSIQRTSSIPVPQFQTEQGSQNPLPLNAPKELNRLEDQTKLQNQQAQGDQFQDYLNQTSITTLEKAQEKSLVFDPAAEIAAASIYGQPGGQKPI